MSDVFDVVVIGSGPGGYVAAIRCAQLGLKTACVEKEPHVGGTCLNVGCIPSKTLLHASEAYWKLKTESAAFGVVAKDLQYNLPQMMAYKQGVIGDLGQGILGLFKKNKVALISGKACFENKETLLVASQGTTRKLQARYFIIATGSQPMALPFLPFDEKKVLSSSGALERSEIPRRLLVIGAGVIGVELGSVYQRLGSEVQYVEFMDRICPSFDPQVSLALQEALTKQGMQFLLSSKVIEAKVEENGVVLRVALPDKTERSMQAEAVLVSIGRKPYTEGLGLDTLGIKVDAKGYIEIGADFRTSNPHIFAIGDVVDGPMLAHKASEEGVAVAELIAGEKPSIDYTLIPNVVYTNPEVASVGLSEMDAKKLNLSYQVGMHAFRFNSRARSAHEEEGFVKILSDKATDRLLGVQIVGAHASELIAEAAVALQARKTALELGHLCHAHPTLSESLKEAALSIHKRAIHK